MQKLEVRLMMLLSMLKDRELVKLIETLALPHALRHDCAVNKARN